MTEWDGIGFNVAMLNRNHVHAVDLTRGMYLLGGLGALGVGTMWTEFRDRWEPGMDVAPTRSARTWADGPMPLQTNEEIQRGKELQHWINKAEAGEFRRVTCKNDKSRSKHERHCGLRAGFPDDRLPKECPYCHGPVKVSKKLIGTEWLNLPRSQRKA